MGGGGYESRQPSCDFYEDKRFGSVRGFSRIFLISLELSLCFFSSPAASLWLISRLYVSFIKTRNKIKKPLMVGMTLIIFEREKLPLKKRCHESSLNQVIAKRVGPCWRASRGEKQEQQTSLLPPSLSPSTTKPDPIPVPVSVTLAGRIGFAGSDPV